MRTLIAWILIISIVGLASAQEREMEWMKLVPLKSTRDEVEKLIGKPEVSFPQYARYRTPDGDFYVWYSTGRCDFRVKDAQWRVPKDTVTTLYFRSHSPRPPSLYVSNIASFE